MTRAEIETAVLKALAEIAPEVDMASLKWDVPLRDQVDLDSFDYLNFFVALHKASGVDVPEADYPKLATIREAIDYLAHRTAACTRNILGPLRDSSGSATHGRPDHGGSHLHTPVRTLPLQFAAP